MFSILFVTQGCTDAGSS